MDTSNRIRLFDEWAKRYDQSIQVGGRFPFDGYQQVLSEIGRAAEIQRGLHVLDLGIGTGNLAALFADQGCSIWGLDFSTQMLEKAREKLPQAILVQADLLADWPPGLDQRFDRIVSAYVLHEFPLSAKLQLLRRLFDRHLTKDGLVVIGDIAFPTEAVRNLAREKWVDLWDEDEFYWAADEAKEAGEKLDIQFTYKQVSSCGGVFVFKSMRSG